MVAHEEPQDAQQCNGWPFAEGIQSHSGGTLTICAVGPLLSTHGRLSFRGAPGQASEGYNITPGHHLDRASLEIRSLSRS
jgi:hypothetical protein